MKICIQRGTIKLVGTLSALWEVVIQNQPEERDDKQNSKRGVNRELGSKTTYVRKVERKRVLGRDKEKKQEVRGRTGKKM